MNKTPITCPHCHTDLIETVSYKSTLCSVLCNGLFGTLSLKENAAVKGTTELENYRCTECGVVFTPPAYIETLMLN